MALGPETLAVTYGLASALTWGASDFAGGYASRKSAVLGVIFLSQLVGGGFILVLALLFSSAVPPLHHFIMGGLAGIFGVLGLVALYMGLARGRMGIVAPISALVTAVIPLAFSLFQEGLPAATKLAGFAFALAAVWFLSYNKTQSGFNFTELVLPVLAGMGFGLFFVLIDQGTGQSVLWPLVAARCASVSLVGGFLLISRTRGGNLEKGPALHPPGRGLRLPGQPLLRPGRQPGPAGRLGGPGLPLPGLHVPPGLADPQGKTPAPPMGRGPVRGPGPGPHLPLRLGRWYRRKRLQPEERTPRAKPRGFHQLTPHPAPLPFKGRGNCLEVPWTQPQHHPINNNVSPWCV